MVSCSQEQGKHQWGGGKGMKRVGYRAGGMGTTLEDYCTLDAGEGAQHEGWARALIPRQKVVPFKHCEAGTPMYRGSV